MKLTKQRKLEILQDEFYELQECNKNLEHCNDILHERIKELETEIFSLRGYVLSLEIHNDKLQIKINELTKGKESK